MVTITDMPALFGRLASFVPAGRGAYLVGGTVRDILMGRESSDVDLAVSCEPGRFARDVAVAMGGSAFAMDAGRGVYRVALREGAVRQVDVSPLKGGIRADLTARDFTINAMAIDITGSRGDGRADWEVIDPFGGRADVTAKLVRALGEATLIEDPLRLARAFRISSQLGFKIESGTLKLVDRHAALIRKVSPERVRDELYMMLACDGIGDTLSGMQGTGLLSEMLPELEPMRGVVQGGPHVHDLLTHSIRAAAHAEAVMADTLRWFGPSSVKVDGYLAMRVDGTADMRGVIKLCSLLHDTGKPATLKVVDGRPRFFGHDSEGAAINAAAAGRLRMSERVKRTLAVTAGMHMRPLNASRDKASRRAVYRMVRDAGDALPALAVVAVADALATRERAEDTPTDVEGLARGLVEYYYGEHEKAKANPLVTGDDIIAMFGLGPGAVIGKILEDVAEKRAEGVLIDRQDALRYVGGNLEKYR